MLKTVLIEPIAIITTELFRSVNMKEEIAKNTLCPEMSGNLAVKDSYGDMLVEFHRVYCFGAECMWWEWNERRNQVGEQLVPVTGHCGAIK